MISWRRSKEEEEGIAAQQPRTPAKHHAHLFSLDGVYVVVPSGPGQLSQVHDESRLARATSLAMGCGLGNRCALATHAAPTRKARLARMAVQNTSLGFGRQCKVSYLANRYLGFSGLFAMAACSLLE
jgi:hypothetical protein